LVYICYREVDGEIRPKQRMAHQNLNVLREKMRKKPGSSWLVARYNLRWTVANICRAIENPSRLEADEIVGTFDSREGGRVQKRRKKREEET
jgi:hypothetical protein